MSQVKIYIFNPPSSTGSFRNWGPGLAEHRLAEHCQHRAAEQGAFFYFFFFLVNFPLAICHCQQCSTMTFTDPLLSGARGSLHSREQTLLARRIRPRPKCQRCWEVISSYIVIDENSLAKEPSNAWSTLQTRYIPWWLQCNPERYPYWFGKPDPRNIDLLLEFQNNIWLYTWFFLFILCIFWNIHAQ